jgi:hypothetical protein
MDHLQHMPSHTYVRVGEWDLAIEVRAVLRHCSTGFGGTVAACGAEVGEREGF